MSSLFCCHLHPSESQVHTILITETVSTDLPNVFLFLTNPALYRHRIPISRLFWLVGFSRQSLLCVSGLVPSQTCVSSSSEFTSPRDLWPTWSYWGWGWGWGVGGDIGTVYFIP